MFKPILSAALCAFALAASSQPFTGITTYPHSNADAYLSSGKPLINGNTNGFVMAGYIPAICCNGDIILIDKVNDAGAAAGPNWFQNTYGCQTGGTSCSATLAWELDCYGVSIVETNVAASATPVVPAAMWYAIATAFNSGVVFSGLDNIGAVSTSGFYPFPAGSTNPTKPLISESLLGPGSYYIAGSYLNSGVRYMYALQVDAAGAVIWSQTYDLGAGTSMTPKAIMENPTAFAGLTFELMVVGYYDASGSGLNDAFLMKLDVASNGAIFTMDCYGAASNNDEFHSISYAANGNGYIVGGYTDANPAAGYPWMLLVDPTNPNNLAAPYWSQHVLSSSDPNAGAIVSTLERVSTTYGSGEYYGTCASANGIMVLKLDGNGNPFFQPGNTNNEFTYDATVHGNPSVPAEISFFNTVGATRQGIQVYGYDWAPGGAAVDYMLVRACFNGVAGAVGCQQNQTIMSATTTGPNWFSGPTPSNAGGLSNCNNFNFAENIVNYAVSTACSAFVLPGGGDNSRSAATGIAESGATETGFQLQPNPASDKVEISYPTGGPVSVSLYNSLGQLVHSSYNDGSDKSMTINLAALNLANGVYVVKASANGTVYQQKLIYNK